MLYCVVLGSLFISSVCTFWPRYKSSYTTADVRGLRQSNSACFPGSLSLYCLFCTVLYIHVVVTWVSRVNVMSNAVKCRLCVPGWKIVTLLCRCSVWYCDVCLLCWLGSFPWRSLTVAAMGTVCFIVLQVEKCDTLVGFSGDTFSLHDL